MTSDPHKTSPLLGSLEGTILSGRYALKEIIGQGAWGTTYRAEDIKLKGEPIAVKVLNPTSTAKEQADYREIDIEENFILKEARRGLEACGHLVRRYAGEDIENGISYIVMNLYGKTLQDDVAKGTDRTRPLALDWMSDITTGIAEYHDIYLGPHCDIKPDNIVIDNWRKKLLLTDFGSSTSTSAAPSQGPRDNMGFIYTRAPRNFKKAEHPKRSYDCYAAGSLLFKFFTGKYILEEEIDKARAGGEDAVADFMASIHPREDKDSESMLEIIVDSKLAVADIPNQFKQFIKDAVLESYFDGGQLKKGFDQAKKSYEELQVKKSVLDTYKKKLRNACLASFLGASILGAGITGLAWTVFYAPQPDYRRTEDMRIIATTLPAEESGLKFCIEREYPRGIAPKEIKSRNAFAIDALESNYKKGTLSYLVAKQFFLTSDQVDYSIPELQSLRARFMEIDRSEIKTGLIDNFLVSLLPRHMALEKASLGPDQDISLESLLTSLLVGEVKCHAMQKSSKSFKFEVYIDAKGPDGKYMVSRETKAFLNAWIPNVWSTLPPGVKRDPTSSR